MVLKQKQKKKNNHKEKKAINKNPMKQEGQTEGQLNIHTDRQTDGQIEIQGSIHSNV